ncbi:metallophosphoesterase [Paludisphaera mucosa]|uniref:Metallophosphoesterase n=1 Tax=Paludisphaera mucosa TaxID=3030827 RepID=A0ABT6F9X7_9BACT|nr:metallophosphoesterase [Paludisphaera mucosa]MDG3004371.1 metallophosphoesterase [Paludisphaera mucosa]
MKPTSMSAAARPLLLTALVAFAPSLLRAEERPGRFLLVSDIHFDPFYDASLFQQLKTSPAENWAEILENSRPAGINPRGTDSNYALLKSSLDEARRRGPDVDFVLYPGDLLAHRWQAKYDRLAEKSHEADPDEYRAFTRKVVEFLAFEFRRRFPETPILPTLGNEDSYCGDYRVEPEGPFLSMFAEVWHPLLGPESGTFRRTFPLGGYFTTRLPRLKNCRLIVLNSVFFSVNYDDACNAEVQVPALDELDWFEDTLARAAAAGEAVWLLMHVPPGINSFNTAESVPRGGPPATFWQPELTRRFLRIVERHPDVVRVAFTGHTHMDDYRLIRPGGGTSIPCKIAPAVSPIFGNNPGFQTYQYDVDRAAVSGFQTYFRDGLGEGRRPTEGRWALEYDFRDAYGFDSLSAGTIGRLAEGIRSNAAVRESYIRFYGVSSAPEITPRTLEYYRCAMTNLGAAAFMDCLPKAPDRLESPGFPDRRPAAVPPTRE